MTTPPARPDRPEIWADIPHWPHQASNNGRIRTANGRILTQRDHNRPVDSDLKYQRVDLCHNGRRETRLVHQLVLLAFYGEPDSKRVDGKWITQEACHTDDNPTHNWIENLHWGWPWENVAERLGQPGYYAPEAAARRSQAASIARAAQDHRDVIWLEDELNGVSGEAVFLHRPVPDNSVSPFRRWMRAASAHAPWHRRRATPRNTPGQGNVL